MSQPKSVPVKPGATPYYESPPRREGSWRPTRPGEVVRDGQPHGDQLGSQGPDQGFAIKLAKRLGDDAVLHRGEHLEDVIAGCVVVALKRASQFMRAPSIHDVRAAFNLFGYLDVAAPMALIEWRRELFAEVHHPHHYAERRAIADLVPADLLRQTPAAIEEHTPEFRTMAMPSQPMGTQ